MKTPPFFEGKFSLRIGAHCYQDFGREKSLLDFVQDVPPADDLTMLAVRRA